MSTFYILPPRPLLGERVAAFLNDLFPGLSLNAAGCTELTEHLSDAAAGQPDVYVIYREDLADDATPEALCNGYGAEDGDEVVEVCAGVNPGEWSAQRWRVAS